MTNTIEITVKVRDQASAETAGIAEKIRSQVKAAQGGGGEIKVPVEPDTAGFDEEVRAKTRRAKPDAIKVPVKADAGDFETEFRKAMEEGEQSSAKASAEIRRSFTAIESGSRSLRAAMADLEPAARETGAGLEGAGRDADNAGKRAESSGAGFSAGAVRMTAMVGAAFALAPALAALPAAAGAAAAGVGAMALGLGGVIKALHDYGAASAGGGQSGAQLAATAFSNAVAIRNAEQAITDAKKQAARGAQDSAEQIENAQRGVVDAERQAAGAAQSSADQIASAQRGVADAAYNLAQAEQRLQDAEKSELDAQKALTQAREDAANQLKDLNNSSADSHLAVERATLNVSIAQENLAKTLGSSLSTDNQKKDAQLALAEAQQGLIDAQQRGVEASQKADAANKAGVDGMQGVVQAQDAVTKGAAGVKDAQHGVESATQAQADAQKTLTRAVQSAADQQVSSAESVAKAEQSLADAQKSAARQQQDSAEAVAKAEQNLSDTYKQQQLAAAAAASAGGGAADKFAQDMAALTPAGQAFVKQLLSMKDGAKQLSDTAQTAMLPGLTRMLKDAGPLLPIFNGAVRDMGGVIGGTAEQFGKLMQSPAFQGALTQVLKDGAGLAKDFGDGLVAATGGIMQAASHAGPIVSGLGDGIKTLLSSGLPDFFSGLTSNANGIGSLFQGILTLVSNLAGPLGTVSGAVATALAPAVQVLASPDVQRSLQSVAVSIGQILIVLSPVITMFAKGLAGALQAVAPLLASTAKFMQDNHRWVVPLAEALGVLAVAFWGLNAAMMANPAVRIALLIIGLVGALIYAWEHFSAFRDFIKQWWPELLAPFTFGVSLIIGHWNTIVDFTKKLPGRLAAAGAAMWNWIGDRVGEASGFVSKKLDGFVTTVESLPGKLARAGAGMWDWVKREFLGAINGIAGLWNQLRFSTPSFHIPIPFTDGINIDSISVGVPPIGPFKAVGGPISGGLSAVIGDGGWEPLRLPDGTTVVPHANAQSMLAEGAGSARGGAVQLEWVGPAGDELFTMIKRWIRVNYGAGPNSVQTALGQ